MTISIDEFLAAVRSAAEKRGQFELVARLDKEEACCVIRPNDFDSLGFLCFVMVMEEEVGPIKERCFHNWTDGKEMSLAEFYRNYCWQDRF